MGKMQVTGMAEFGKKLQQLGGAGEAIAKMGVYDGAKVIVEEVKKSIRSLPEEKMRFLKKGDRFSVLTDRNKADLVEHLGIASMDTIGGASTRIGFEGYSSIRTKKYPSGIPVVMMARSIESGSSVREKHPFFRPAVNRARHRAEDECVQTMEKQIKKTMED